MQTLAEIEQAEHIAREKAWRYGQLVNQRDSLRKTIAKLSATRTTDAAVLVKIRDLAGQVDPLLTMRPLPFLPGGLLVSDLLHRIATQALESVERAATLASAELADAQSKLASVEDALKEFA